MTDRAVSVTVNYVLTLAITTVLMTGLLFAAGNVVEDRRDSASRSELRVVGERVAAGLLAADRLAQTDPTEVVVVTEGPDRIAGLEYTVSLNATEGEVVLSTSNPEIVVSVPFDNTTTVSDSTTNGGEVLIVLEDPGGANEALEVRSS